MTADAHVPAEGTPPTAIDTTTTTDVVDAVAPAVADAAATDAVPTAVGAAPAVPRKRRRLVLRAGVLWLLRAAIGIGMFVGGLALGVSFFWSQQPAPLPIADPATNGIPTPAIVREFVGALESNDEDALRAAVAGDPYRLIAGEMQQWGFREVTAVETLATMLNGERTATQIVMRGRDIGGAPIVINLVVHEQDGSITTFR